MNGQIKYYLQKWWNKLGKAINGPNGFGIIAILVVGGVGLLFMLLAHFNPATTPAQTLSQRIVALENVNEQLQSEQALMLEDLQSFKHQNHNLTQALITITTDIAKLNDMYNSRDLSVTYSSEVEEVRQQVDANMKLISDTISGAEGGK